MPQDTALLIYADSENDANMLYATRFFVPDAFIFIQIQNHKTVIMSDLEIDRAKSEASVDEVLSFSEIAEQLKKSGAKKIGTADIIAHLLHSKSISQVKVPANFPLFLADALRHIGITIQAVNDPFFPEREIKSQSEVDEIRLASRGTESAIRKAIETLRACTIQDGKLWLNAQVLTSEDLRKIIHIELLEQGCLASRTIVASGPPSCDPHNMGSGPLFANSPIILDVFPCLARSHYHADITRTVCRGKAPEKLKNMYNAVREGQEMGTKMIRAGASGRAIHETITKHLTERGFPTGPNNGRMEGFFHGTGHGLGLDVHESPRISRSDDILKAGQVVTVEPGLYYADIGGVRLEDDIWVTKDGCIVLTELEKELEIL